VLKKSKEFLGETLPLFKLGTLLNIAGFQNTGKVSSAGSSELIINSGTYLEVLKKLYLFK